MFAHYASVEVPAVGLSVSELGGTHLTRWLLSGLHLKSPLDPFDHTVLMDELNRPCASTRNHHFAHLLAILQTNPTILLTDIPLPAILEWIYNKVLHGIHGSHSWLRLIVGDWNLLSFKLNFHLWCLHSLRLIIGKSNKSKKQLSIKSDSFVNYH